MTPEIVDKQGKPHALIPLEFYEQLVEDAEMLADIRAFDAAKERNEESFPQDVVERMTLGGDHPLKVLREYRGMTQEELAEAAGGISRVYISDIELGKKNGSAKVLRALAHVLQVDMEMLV
jgi:DNA-binding XRE family transcriptional regulator